MNEPWQPDAVTMGREPWQPAAPPPDLRYNDGVAAVIDGLRDLGMLKANEQPSQLHQYGCPSAKPPWPDGTCICPGGPELQYPDWDELKPVRHYTSPERFHVRH
jgi:hypothetical protein